jgi:hypothetical protein
MRCRADQFLGVVDLAQIKYVPLRCMAADYRHIGGLQPIFDVLARGAPCRSTTCSAKIAERWVESAKSG